MPYIHLCANREISGEQDVLGDLCHMAFLSCSLYGPGLTRAPEIIYRLSTIPSGGDGGWLHPQGVASAIRRDSGAASVGSRLRHRYDARVDIGLDVGGGRLRILPLIVARVSCGLARRGDGHPP